MSHFEKNLAILQRVRPRLGARIAATEPLEPGRLVPTKSGGWTAQATTPEGKTILLASRYRPEEEARRLIDAHELGPTTTYVVFGMGVGHHVAELHRRKAAESRIVVVESDPRIFRAALEALDLEAILTDEKVHLHVGERLAELFIELRDYIFEIFGVDSRIVFVGHRPSMEVAPDFYRSFQALWDDFLRASKMSLESAMVLARQSFENRLGNLTRYLPSPGVRVLANRYAGLPAVIVSAGPSLHRNVHLLPVLQGRAVLIAVSTALKPLLARGIRPTLSVLLDYHDVSRRYFDRIDPEIAATIPLVCDPKAAPAAVEAYSGPLLFGADVFLDQLFPGIGEARGDLPPGTTVAHTAFHVAHICGCDPIVFVGQDLAYSHHVTHVPGTAIFNQWLPELNRFQTLETKEWESILRLRGVLKKVEAVDGSEVYTDGQMLSYRKDFEVMIALGGRTYIDATEGGARIEGTKVMTLAEVVEAYAAGVPPDRVGVPVEPRPAAEDRPLYEALRKRLDERLREVGEARRLYEEAHRLLQGIAERIERGDPVDHEIRRVQEIRTRCRQYDAIFHAVSNLAFTDSLDRQVADRRIRSQKLAGRELQREQARRDLEFVQGFVKSLELFGELLTGARERIERELAS